MMFRGKASGSAYAFDVTEREHEYLVQRLNQQDLDRNLCVSTSSLFKWMQAARMELAWLQAGYKNLSHVEPQLPRRLLVASQGLRIIRPAALSEGLHRSVLTRVSIGKVGKTSMEFRYEIFFEADKVADGCTVMIFATGPPGSFTPTPVPEDLKALAAEGLDASPAELSRSVPDQVPANAYRTRASVRFSDEDLNKHANHSAQARFFEDAREELISDTQAPPELRRLASGHTEALAITYLSEAHALDELGIFLAPSKEPLALDVWVQRTQPDPRLLAKGRIRVASERSRATDSFTARL